MDSATKREHLVNAHTAKLLKALQPQDAAQLVSCYAPGHAAQALAPMLLGQWYSRMARRITKPTPLPAVRLDQVHTIVQ